MKKILLSTLALAAVVMMVACNNTGKVVEKQVAAINAATMRIDSVVDAQALEVVLVDMNQQQATITAELNGAEVPAEQQEMITVAQATFNEKYQTKASEFAAAAAQAAAVADSIAQAEAAKIKKK